jgi:hypothetical protein
MVFCLSTNKLVVVVSARRMTPNSSSTFLYRMLVIIVWYVPDCHTLVCYWGWVMRTPRRGCLFLYIAYVHTVLLLLISQSGQRMTCLHVLYCDLHIPLDSVLFCGDLPHSWLYKVLHVRNAMFRSAFEQVGNSVNEWIMILKCDPFLSFVFAWEYFCLCVLIILFFKLWKICNGKPLFLAMVRQCPILAVLLVLWLV